MLLLEHRSQRKPYSIRTEGFNCRQVPKPILRLSSADVSGVWYGGGNLFFSFSFFLFFFFFFLFSYIFFILYIWPKPLLLLIWTLHTGRPKQVTGISFSSDEWHSNKPRGKQKSGERCLISIPWLSDLPYRNIVPVSQNPSSSHMQSTTAYFLNSYKKVTQNRCDWLSFGYFGRLLDFDH